MKKIIVMVSALLVLMSTTAFAMSTKDYDARMAKGINYYNNGKYLEALDEFTWFKDAHYWDLNDGQQRYLNSYIEKTKKKIDGQTSTGMTTKEYDAKMAKAIEYYNNGKYYEALDEFTWFKDAHYKNLNDGQKRYLDNYIDKTNQKINAFSVGMNTFEFDYGMSVGIYFFNNGMFYEAKEAFEDFKSISYSKMNAGQKAYFDDWYNGTLREIEKIENVVEPMSTYEFDQGMKKGINYFNRGMYQEATEEFDWFIDANAQRMNQGQFDYAYDYLMGAFSRGLAWIIAEEADNLIHQGYSYEEAIEYVEMFYYNVDSIIAEAQTSEEMEYEITIDYDAFFGIIGEKINDLCYKWFSSTGTPVAMVDYGVDYDDYGDPVPWFEVRNISGRTVASYKIEYWCYDNYGYLTDGYGYSGGVDTNVNDIWVGNGDTYYCEAESLYFGNYVYTDFIDDVVITEVTFSDGRTWYR